MSKIPQPLCCRRCCCPSRTGAACAPAPQYSAADWVVDSSWKWSPLYAVSYGKATGAPTVTKWGPIVKGVQGEIWTRKFANGATVTVNCSTSPGKWCTGTVAGGDRE